MSKKSEIRAFACTFMSHPSVMALPAEKRVDASIAMAELLWQRLEDRGYGITAEGEPKENKSWYSHLQDPETFDKAWSKFGKLGSKNAAAKAWLKVEESAKQVIILAIPKYIEQLHATGTSKAHFSTWLNDRRWESFDVTQKTQIKAVDERAQEIAALRKMVAQAKDDKTRQAFQAQLDRLSN